KFTAGGVWRAAGGWNVSMLGQKEGLEAAFFSRPRELWHANGFVSGKNRYSVFHVILNSLQYRFFSTLLLSLGLRAAIRARCSRLESLAPAVLHLVVDAKGADLAVEHLGVDSVAVHILEPLVEIVMARAAPRLMREHPRRRQALRAELLRDR